MEDIDAAVQLFFKPMILGNKTMAEYGNMKWKRQTKYTFDTFEVIMTGLLRYVLYI